MRLRRVGICTIVVPSRMGIVGTPVVRGRVHWRLQKRPQRCREKKEWMPSGPRSAGPQFCRWDMMTGSERMLSFGMSMSMGLISRF